MIYGNTFLNEDAVLNEWGAEDDATNLKKIKKWYSTFISATKNTKKDDLKDIDEKIKALEECREKMKKSLKEQKMSDKLSYAAKSFIPFNSLYRLIKKGDCYAGFGILGDMFIPGISLGIRFATYSDMLQKFIDETDEAIEYLKKKRKEIDSL